LTKNVKLFRDVAKPDT